MKKTNKGTIFILVMILISIASIIAYVVLDNTYIMGNNFLFSSNEKELNKNLKEKADINLQSTVKYYLNGNRDDNNYSRLSLLSIVPEKLDYYNIFWNNYKAQEIIDNNTLNTDLPKISEVSNGNLFLNLSSSSPLSYKIKLVKFDKTLYTNDNILVPLETLESADFLTSTGGYLQTDLSLNLLNGGAYNFDFTSNDYAIFIKNNSLESIQVSLRGEDLAGSGIYLNAIDESNANSSTGVVKELVNHIIISEDSYIGDNYLTSTSGRDISRYGNCYTGGTILTPKSVYEKGTENQCDTPDILICTGDNAGYTLSSCNVGATIAGSGTTYVSETNGNLFQWGNNYPFPSSGELTSTSTGQVSASRPFSSSTFITDNFDWANPSNDDLWGGSGDTITSRGFGTDLDRQGPCADGYYVPSISDWKKVIYSYIYDSFKKESYELGNSYTRDTDVTQAKFQLDFKLPYTNNSIVSEPSKGTYSTSTPSGLFYSEIFQFESNKLTVVAPGGGERALASVVRCFRNDDNFFGN